MSGLEIAGLALGAIPVATAALQFYRTVFLSFSSATDQIIKIERDLEIERVRLHATLQSLLTGIVPAWDMDDLLRNPAGQDWKFYEQDVRLKLGDTERIVRQEIGTIDQSIKELNVKLDLDEDGKTRLKEPRSIMRELDYVQVIEKIKNSNLIIAELYNVRPTSGADNRSRSESRLIKALRPLYQGMFEAVTKASSCACKSVHILLLELEHEKKCILPHDEDEDVLRGLAFHIIFEQGQGLGSDNTKGGHPEINKQSDHHTWTSLNIRRQKNPGTGKQPQSKEPEKTKIPKVRFETPRNPGYTENESNPLPETKNSILRKPLIIQGYLCGLIATTQKSREVDCYGLVADGAHAFGIFSRRCADIGGSLTLRQILQVSRGVSLLDQLFGAKLSAALDIATGVVYLFSTPWLPKRLTLDDFLLVQNEKTPSEPKTSSTQRGSQTCLSPYSRDALNQVGAEGQATPPTPEPEPEVLMILDCGILLAQLFVGSLVSELGKNEIGNQAQILSTCEVGLRAASRIQEKAGDDCASAVTWCFTHVRNALTLGKATRWPIFHREVVAKLEQGLKDFHEN